MGEASGRQQIPKAYVMGYVIGRLLRARRSICRDCHRHSVPVARRKLIVSLARESGQVGLMSSLRRKKHCARAWVP